MTTIPTKRSITKACAAQGITVPKGHRLLDDVQHAYRRVEERGGIQKIGADIEARIEAARARLANKSA